MAGKSSAQRVHQVRHFNRFYTRQIGVLQEHLLQSPYSLTEARIIYDLAHIESTTATELGNALGLDAGYLSRTLRAFQKSGLITKQTSKTDGRQSLLRLTDKGHAAFAKLNALSQTQIEGMLSQLSLTDQNRLVEAMQTIETLLNEHSEQPASYILRPHRPGDMGWVVSTHGALYAQEYGWDETFEALVAEIVAQFIKNFDPRYERCWIAERNGENVGSVFIVKKSETVAKLRMLIVTPSARGLGLGKRLVEECIQFARQAGYIKITLWTNSVLTAARHIYQSVGFKLIEQEPQPNFSKDLISETWELDLTEASAKGSALSKNLRVRKSGKSSATTQIRLSTIDEVGAVSAVLKGAFAPYKARYKPKALAATTPDSSTLHDRFHDGPVWVAVKNGEIVGTVAAVVKGEGLYVRSLAVLPQAQGAGLAYSLLQQAEQYARDQNCHYLFLSTAPFLTPAIKLYERFGFVRTGDGPHELYGTPLFTMTKGLVPADHTEE